MQASTAQHSTAQHGATRAARTAAPPCAELVVWSSVSLAWLLDPGHPFRGTGGGEGRKWLGGGGVEAKIGVWGGEG